MDLQTAIIKTLGFFDLFDYPMTAGEIKQYLYQYTQPVHIKEIKGVLSQMENVEQLKEYYFLKGRGEIVTVRQSRKFRAEQYWNRVKFYGLHMRRIPFIRMIAVCNSLSYNNVSEASDIDLLIVTAPEKLWTTRVFLSLLLHFFGVRRHGTKIAGRFCLSFFVTTERLNFAPLALEPEDPYLAYWTLLLCPIEGAETYALLQASNRDWLQQNYGLTFPEDRARHFYPAKPSWLKCFLETMFSGFLGNLLERFLKSKLEKRAKKKSAHLDPATSGVVIDAGMLKFHDFDRRREYYERWQRVICF